MLVSGIYLKPKKPLGIVVFKFEHAQESLGELINNMDSKVLPPKLWILES